MARLVDRADIVSKERDFFGIGVHAGDVEAEFRQADACHEPDITGSDDRDLQDSLINEVFGKALRSRPICGALAAFSLTALLGINPARNNSRPYMVKPPMSPRKARIDLATLQIIHTSHNFGIWSYPAKHLRIRRSPCLKREHRDRNALRIPFLCRFARRCFSPLRNLSRLPSTWR